MSRYVSKFLVSVVCKFIICILMLKVFSNHKPCENDVCRFGEGGHLFLRHYLRITLSYYVARFLFKCRYEKYCYKKYKKDEKYP